MKKFQLILITENQKTEAKANKLARLISETLACKNVVEVAAYDKLDNSYRIEIVGLIGSEENPFEAAVKLTDQICSPWAVTYRQTNNEMELFFNKTTHSKFRKDNFNVVLWGNFEIILE
jgi:hypothetical protein